jgi:AcrR family transcriptional regulator
MKATTTQENILRAAVALVSEKGYLGATTREIARAAGVTELTVFRHFGSKERLFEALLGRCTFLPALKELLPQAETLPYEEALRTIGERFLLSLKERKPMVKILHSEVNLYPDKIRKVYNHFIDETRCTLASYFESQQRKGVLRRFPAEPAARAFLGMLFSYFRAEEIVRGVDITKNRRMQETVKEFVNIFAHGTLRTKNGATERRRS